MAVVVTHSTVATLPDEPGAEVNKAEWNANHQIVGLGTAAEAATTDFDAAGVADAAVAAHEAAFDPHTQYLDKQEGDGLYVGADINLRCAITQIANIATSRLLGRVTAATGFVEVLTGTQATTLLDTFTSLLKGLVPASGGGTSNFLRADGSFSAPATLAHATTHKSGGSDSIKLDELAAPTDVTTLDASTLAHGLLPKLAGGTTTFLRADGTYATPTATAADPSYSPGSFTIATETSRHVGPHVKFTGTQRMTLQGTGRLSLMN